MSRLRFSSRGRRMPDVQSLLLAALLALPLLQGEVLAQNRLVVDDIEVPIGSTGNEVSVRIDSDQAILGFSVNLEFDDNDVNITEIRLGSDVAGLEPEWSDGTIDNTLGRLTYAVVFDFSGPDLSKQLAAGDGMEVLVLVVDAVRTSAGSDTLNLLNVNSAEPRRLNVFTDVDGNSIQPTLEDGTVTIIDQSPVISGFSNNSGPAGTEFFINGDNFDQPELAVEVCGVAADHELLGDGSIRVTAPECGEGPALVEVCNVHGCDSDAAGFTYPDQPGAPEIEGFQLNSGAPGQLFFISGTDFDQGGLSVQVCGNDAEFLLLPDLSIQVTAPNCDSVGLAQVLVCTDLGCDSDPAGFNFTEIDVEGAYRRGDTNGDGSVDLSDGIATLAWLFLGATMPGCIDAANANSQGGVDLADAVFTFNFLFLGGAMPAAPFPGCGNEGLTDCETYDAC